MARTTRSPLLQALQAVLAMSCGVSEPRPPVGVCKAAPSRSHTPYGWPWLHSQVPFFAAGTGIWLGQVGGPCPPGVCVHGQVPPAEARSLASLRLSVNFYGGYTLGLSVLFAAGFAAIARFLFWRSSHDLLVLYICLVLVIFGLSPPFNTGLMARLGALSPGGQLPVGVLQFLGAAAFGILEYIFADGRCVPR